MLALEAREFAIGNRVAMSRKQIKSMSFGMAIQVDYMLERHNTSAYAFPFRSVPRTDTQLAKLWMGLGYVSGAANNGHHSEGFK